MMELLETVFVWACYGVLTLVTCVLSAGVAFAVASLGNRG